MQTCLLGGEIKYYRGYHAENHPEQVIRFCVDFKRYLVRKIGSKQ